MVRTADLVAIRIVGKHGSVGDLLWEEVPPFAVLTGGNGAGKTQLLEVLASSFQALRSGPDHRGINPPTIQAQAEIDGCEFKPGEVFHSYGDWPQLPEGGATEDQIADSIRNLRIAGPRQEIQWWETALTEAKGLSVDHIRKLSDKELYPLLTPGMLWAHRAPGYLPNLSFLFLSYALLRHDAEERGESPEEIGRRFGEPPWDLLNEILSASHLPYEVNKPLLENLTRTMLQKPSFVVRLRDVYRDAEIALSGLSSGERIIMSTVLWRYSAEHVGPHYRLLLLDEPDAHLHPALARQFFDVLQDVFVRKRGVRVILTTHSPSTVALTPQACIFEMCRHSVDPGQRIRPIERDSAISLLTAGLLVVTEKTRFVFVEGKGDPDFYQTVWELCTRAVDGESIPVIAPTPSLIFRAVGAHKESGANNSGKEQVRRIVRELRKYSLPNPISGIIDRDDGNAGGSGIYVPTERRAIENYLYDPLLVWTALRLYNSAPIIEGIQIPEGQEHRLRTLPAPDLQSIADAVLASVESIDWPTEAEKVRRPVHFNRGDEVIVLQYPAWQLDRSKADIRAAYHRTHNCLNQRQLLYAFRVVRLVPKDLREMLERIQAEESN